MSLYSLFRSSLRYFVIWTLFHVPMACIRWSQRYICNDTRSRLLLLLYTIVDTRRTFGKQHLKFSLKNQSKTLVNVYKKGGGMGFNDMMKGIVFISSYCEQKGFRHKIYRKYPFDLDCYLQPATYDWRITTTELNTLSCGMVLRVVIGHLRCLDTERYVLDMFCSLYGVSHILVSISAPCSEDDFRILFPRIFRTSLSFEKKLADFSQGMRGKWKSVSFRFANLLGDSDESISGLAPLEGSDAERLMLQCFDNMLSTCLGSSETFPRNDDVTNLLITTDSYKFAKFVESKGQDNLFVLDGDEIGHHIGFGQRGSEKSVTKMFCEYFLISRACEAYQIIVGPMYESGFPRYAAAINAVPYKIISFPFLPHS